METKKKKPKRKKILLRDLRNTAISGDFNLDVHKALWNWYTPDNYEYTDQLKKLIPDILKYFNGIEGKFDLSRGLYIHGKFGVGKTMLMDITRKYIAAMKNFSPVAFRISSTEKIVNHFRIHNNLDLFGYNTQQDYKGVHNQPVNLLINEFATESKYKNIKHYGSGFTDEYESMLMARYEVFTDQKKLTHCTSNYAFKQLANIYSEKILDRFLQMFNFIEFKGDSWR